MSSSFLMRASHDPHPVRSGIDDRPSRGVVSAGRESPAGEARFSSPPQITSSRAPVRCYSWPFVRVNRCEAKFKSAASDGQVLHGGTSAVQPGIFEPKEPQAATALVAHWPTSSTTSTGG